MGRSHSVHIKREGEEWGKIIIIIHERDMGSVTTGVRNEDAELCVWVVHEGAAGSLRDSADWEWGEKEREETDKSSFWPSDGNAGDAI